MRELKEEASALSEQDVPREVKTAAQAVASARGVAQVRSLMADLQAVDAAHANGPSGRVMSERMRKIDAHLVQLSSREAKADTGADFSSLASHRHMVSRRVNVYKQVTSDVESCTNIPPHPTRAAAGAF